MEQFPCKITITTYDRRKRLQRKKVYENDTSFAVRHIKDDRSFHMVIKSGTKTEVYISSKIQISDNVLTHKSISLNIPEFRSMVIIDQLPGCDHSLSQIMRVFSPTDKEDDSITTTVDEVLSPQNKENNRKLANRKDSGSPEKLKYPPDDKKKKLRSPLKSGATPCKKKDRVGGCQRDTALHNVQAFSLLVDSTSCGDNAGGRDSQSRNCRPSERQSISPDEVSLTETQLAVLERCKEGANVFLTGGAGTGKSHLLKCILDEMVVLHGKNAVFVTATTGIAAVSIGGTTVHQFAGIRPGDTISDIGDSFKQAFKNQSVIRRWRQAQVLIVDEISMMSPQALELINSVAQDARGTTAMMGGVQVIFTGDFLQLPPVSRTQERTSKQTLTQVDYQPQTQPSFNKSTKDRCSGEERFCFESSIWKTLFSSSNTFVLNEVHRQKDENFSKLLNAIRWGDCSDEVCDAFRSCVRKELDSSDGILPTKIFTHRRDVDNLNNLELKKLTGEMRTYRAIDDGEKTYVQMLQNHCPARPQITLKLGAQVVLLKSIAPQDGLVNGSRGVVVAFTKTTKRPIVKFVGGVCRPICNESFLISLGGRVVAQRFQMPLDLAWGISVHKSQGISVDKAVLFIKNTFEYGQAYVALSRVKTMDGLSLSHNLQNCCIKAHPDVKLFYEELLKRKARSTMEKEVNVEI